MLKNNPYIKAYLDVINESIGKRNQPITIKYLKEQLIDCDPDETIGFMWNCYSDGGEDCCGFEFDGENLIFNQYNNYDDEQSAPTCKEVLEKINTLSEKQQTEGRVYGYWEDNDDTTYSVIEAYGCMLELDGNIE